MIGVDLDPGYVGPGDNGGDDALGAACGKEAKAERAGMAKAARKPERPVLL